MKNEKKFKKEIIEEYAEHVIEKLTGKIIKTVIAGEGLEGNLQINLVLKSPKENSTKKSAGAVSLIVKTNKEGFPEFVWSGINE